MSKVNFSDEFKQDAVRGSNSTTPSGLIPPSAARHRRKPTTATRPVDMMVDKAHALPTFPPAKQHQQNMINRIFAG